MKNNKNKKPSTQKKGTLKDHVSVKDLKATKEIKGGSPCPMGGRNW
jgi:hypothetical protein